MYVILTSKPGQFRTEAVVGLRPLEAYDYLFYGHTKAHFVIAELLEESTKIRVIEDDTAIVNDVPSKFLVRDDGAGVQGTHAPDDVRPYGNRIAQDAAVGKLKLFGRVLGMIQVTFLTNNGKVAGAPENSNLLRVSLREQGGIPFKCGGGVCGTCKCRIEAGLENTDAVKPKERKHLTEEQLKAGYRMACQTFLNGDVSVSWVPLAERRAPAQRTEPVTAPPPDAPA